MPAIFGLVLVVVAAYVILAPSAEAGVTDSSGGTDTSPGVVGGGILSNLSNGLGLSTKLSISQIYNFALGAGFPSDTAMKMTAIALRESSGNPNAYNGKPPDDSYGLWQINMIGTLGDRRLIQFGLSQKSDLFDPATNAAAAFMIWNGDDNNLNTAWAINNTTSPYGYAAKYQANLALVQSTLAADSGVSA